MNLICVQGVELRKITWILAFGEGNIPCAPFKISPIISRLGNLLFPRCHKISIAAGFVQPAGPVCRETIIYSVRLPVIGIRFASAVNLDIRRTTNKSTNHRPSVSNK